MLVFTVGILSGCKQSHDIRAEYSDRFSIKLFQQPAVGFTETRECALVPGAQGFDDIAKWLSENRDGWGNYLVTPAIGRALISGNGFRLHVYDASLILAFTDADGKPNQLAKDRASGELDFVFELPCE